MKGLDAAYTKKVYALLHKKHLEAIRIYDLTVQIGDSLNHNDEVSTQLYLNMRQDALVAATFADEEINDVIYNMPEDWQGRMLQLKSADWKDLIIQNADETNVGLEWEKVQRLLEKTIVLDKELVKKIGGKDSYYNK